MICSRWSIIVSKLPGRTDNDVKNYWNTKLKKKYHGGHGVGALAPSRIDLAACGALAGGVCLLNPPSTPGTISSGGDLCFAAAAPVYRPPQPMQRLVRLEAPPPHAELAPMPTAATATQLDEAFLADLGAYGDLLFGGMMQDDKAAVAGLELSAAACYFPNMAEMMWAGDHAHARPQQGLYNTFT